MRNFIKLFLNYVYKQSDKEHLFFRQFLCLVVSLSHLSLFIPFSILVVVKKQNWQGLIYAQISSMGEYNRLRQDIAVWIEYRKNVQFYFKLNITRYP